METHFRFASDCFDWGHRDCAVGFERDLRRLGRSRHALFDFLREWDVQVHGWRKDVDAHRAGGLAADRADHCGPAGSEQAFRRSAGSCLRAEPGARRLPFERWRKELAKNSLSRRKHRRDRSSIRTGEFENDSCGAVANAPTTVEHLSAFEWAGQRALSLD